MKISVFVMAIMVMYICAERISEEKDLVLVEQRRPGYCRFPKGKHGSVRNDECIQNTCTNGKWKPKMRTDICCYKQQVHKPNTVLDKIVSADNCSSTTVECGAVAQLQFNHRTCATPSSKQQVEKLETNLEQKIEQVAAKIENLTETGDKQADEINQKLDKKVQEINNNIETLENNIESHVNDLSDKVETLETNIESHVNDLSDKVETLETNIERHVNDLSDKVETLETNIESRVNDLSDKVETLETNIESLAQTVKENNADQAEMSLQIMRTLANLTQLMEKQSEDTTPMVEGVLITGGWGAFTSTELFLPHTGKTCSLQSLPDSRAWHTLDVVADKILLCGGQLTQTTCLEFLSNSSTGSWAHYATLAQRREIHTSLVFYEDLLMLGGRGSPGTTEIIGKGAHYDLQQDTSFSCSIPDGASTILAGGYSGSSLLKTVVRYNLKGFVGNLPDLTTARHTPGCGSYLDKGNEKVLVVAGGSGGGSSTELLTPGATSWTSGESLPRTLYFARSVNMDGYLLLIGGSGDGNRGEILKFDGTWTEVGMMKHARHGAGATRINMNAYNQLDITACY